jgi:hypothetical protein
MHRKATFPPRPALHCLGVRELRCYPALLSIAVRLGQQADAAAIRSLAERTKHLISGGFSS